MYLSDLAILEKDAFINFLFLSLHLTSSIGFRFFPLLLKLSWFMRRIGRRPKEKKTQRRNLVFKFNTWFVRELECYQ